MAETYIAVVLSQLARAHKNLTAKIFNLPCEGYFFEENNTSVRTTKLPLPLSPCPLYCRPIYSLLWLVSAFFTYRNLPREIPRRSKDQNCARSFGRGGGMAHAESNRAATTTYIASRTSSNV